MSTALFNSALLRSLQGSAKAQALQRAQDRSLFLLPIFLLRLCARVRLIPVNFLPKRHGQGVWCLLLALSQNTFLDSCSTYHGLENQRALYCSWLLLVLLENPEILHINRAIVFSYPLYRTSTSRWCFVFILIYQCLTLCRWWLVGIKLLCQL